MKQKLFIFLALMMLLLALVGLNAVSYVREEEKPDDEFSPNRSTYHAGGTGTRALYDLLVETGRKPMRWQEKVSALNSESKNKPETFVVVGSLRQPFTDEEVKALLRWVSLGGRLVVIDRKPRKDLISTTAGWEISALDADTPPVDVDPSFALGLDPSDQQQMTNGTVAVKPSQPTLFTRSVNAVQPSRFASAIRLETVPFGEAPKTIEADSLSSPAPPTDDYAENYEEEEAEPPVAAPGETKIRATSLSAPVIHFADGRGKILLADFPYGSGQIVFLADPYIVSNAGIALVDNAQLAVNIVAARGGTIAFDEFHQGFGEKENRLLAFFAGTPIPALFAQLAVLTGALLYTQSRRFARPLPARAANRLSKLEYVSAMAELQKSTRAYDLAIENIYTEFRRRVAKSFGVDNFLISREDLAALVAERAKLSAGDIESLMHKCEDIIHGEATNKKEVLELTGRLRELEEKIGLKRTRRQAFKK